MVTANNSANAEQNCLTIGISCSLQQLMFMEKSYGKLKFEKVLPRGSTTIYAGKYCAIFRVPFSGRK